MFDVHLIITSWFIFSKMSSLVRRFITASSKDQSSNKPLFKQIGPILKHFKQCQCQPVKFFFSLRFDLSWETSDWRQANSVRGETDEIRRDNPTIHFTFPPPLHTHTHTQNTPTHAQKGPNRLLGYPYLKHIFSQEYLVFPLIFVPFSWTIKACKKSKKAVKEKGKFVILLKY